MKAKITKVQMKNLKMAREYWLAIDPASVDLSWYRGSKDRSAPALLRKERKTGDTTPHCGASACFGGWLPHFPHFQAQDVRVGMSGEPKIGSKDFVGGMVSHELFGWSLFAPSGGRSYPKDSQAGTELCVAFTGPEYEQVMQRLDFAIKNSEVV